MVNEPRPPGAETFSAERTCDRYRPLYYAAVSGDWNPIHVDPEAARRGGLPGVVLHGMCTLSWVAEACVRWLGDPTRLAALSARFARPVFPGDTVRITGQGATGEGGRSAISLSAMNQRGEEVLKGALAEGRPSPAGPGAGQEAPAQAGGGAAAPPEGPFAAAVGRRYGPFRYVAGLEEMRDFAAVLWGGVPGRVFAADPPERPHPLCWDEEAARAGPYRGLVAPPTYCVRFALQPFARACVDPALGVDLPRLLHGEQAFRFGAPVRPGDELTTVGELVDARQKPGMSLFTVESTTTGPGGGLVVSARWTALVRDGQG